MGYLSNQYNFWSEIINTALVTLLIGTSSYLVLDDTIKIGEMMAITTISFTIIGAINRIATTNIQIQEARVAFDRMYEFTNLSYKNKTINNINSDKIEGGKWLIISRISFRFPGRTQLLHDVSFTVNQGKITILLGEIGSGKSILLQILQKFLPYENGVILIDGNIPLHDISDIEWRRIISVVPQETKIFSGTILDNILLGNVLEEGEKVISFCQKYGFDTYFQSMPQSYFTIVGEDGVNLSGGQKQLIAIARALYRNPKVLFLDEPTSAMDSKTEKFVIDLLQSIKEEITILMITHKNTLFEYADDLFELQNGKVLKIR